MRLSFFAGVFDATPLHREISWEELCKELREPHPVTLEKEAAPCLSPAEYSEGSTRNKKNVVRCHMAVLDIDGIGTEALAKLNDTLEPYAHVMHTTLSHPAKFKADGSYALRVLMPLTEPVLAADWPRFWQALDAMTGHVADPKCKDPSRLYILPTYYPHDPAPLVDIHAGSPLNPSHLIANTPQSPANALSSTQELPQGQRVDLSTIRTRAKNLARYKDEPAKLALAANLRNLLRGEPYGEEGKRNATMLTLTMELDRLFPAASSKSIAALFAPSHQAMTAADPSPPDSLELVERAVDGARAMRRERMQRLADQADRALRQRIRKSRGDGADTPYSDDEIDLIASMHGLDPENLEQHWILRAGTRVHFLTLHGYTEGYSQQGIMPVAAHYLAPVPRIRLRGFPTANATERKFRSFDEVMGEYGTEISDVVYDLRAEYTRFDPTTDRLVISTAARAQLTPTEHPDVHNWLTLLGGDKALKFLSWIACVPDMDKNICAVYLNGAPGVGKTLFAQGLAKIWKAGTPTTFARAIGRFNLELASCPLVFADEGFPNLPPKQLAIELRTLVGSEDVKLEQKFGGIFPLIGPRRLIMAANNASMLDFKSELSQNDIEALAVRIMQIEPDIKARDVFRSLNPQEIRQWQTHKIAEHALWLQQTMQIEHVPGNRFAVQGELDAMMRHVIVDSYWPSLACQVIVKYITDIKRRSQKPDGFIRWGEGHLYVNQHGLEAAWDELLPRGPRPPARMASVLRSLSASDKSKCLKVQGMVRRYWEINLEVLMTWCEENGYVADEIKAILATEPEATTPLRVVGNE